VLARLGAVLLACLLCVQCAGTETGNPSVGTLSYNAWTTDQTRVALRAESDAEIELEQVWLNLGEVAFLPCSGETSESLAKVPALGAADHAGFDAAQVPVELGSERVCELRVGLQASVEELPSGAPAELAASPIVLIGRLRDGTPFRLVAPSVSSLNLLTLQSAGFASSTMPALLLAFDVARWLDGLDLNNAERLGDSILVNSEHNTERLAQFEANLAPGVTLFEDAAANGQVASDAERLAQGQ
jgi:hypothetical protein